jgi:hypothetical protein
VPFRTYVSHPTPSPFTVEVMIVRRYHVEVSVRDVGAVQIRRRRRDADRWVGRIAVAATASADRRFVAWAVKFRTGCSSVPFGAMPVCPCFSSQNPTPTVVTDPASFSREELETAP